MGPMEGEEEPLEEETQSKKGKKKEGKTLGLKPSARISILGAFKS